MMLQRHNGLGLLCTVLQPGIYAESGRHASYDWDSNPLNYVDHVGLDRFYNLRSQNARITEISTRFATPSHLSGSFLPQVVFFNNLPVWEIANADQWVKSNPILATIGFSTGLCLTTSWSKLGMITPMPRLVDQSWSLTASQDQLMISKT